MDYKQRLFNDFNNFDSLLNDINHPVIRYYNMYLNGDYGEEIFNKWFNRYKNCKTHKQIKSLVIQSFLEYNALDYNCKSQQVQRWLMRYIGIDKLELLNNILIENIKDIYNPLLSENIK